MLPSARDTAGRVAKIVDPLGNTTSFADDENGIVVQATQVDLSQVERLGPEAFVDPHHLTLQGNEIFTRALPAALKEIIAP